MNPTKEIKVNFDIEKVRNVVKSLVNHTDTAKLDLAEDTMGYYKFTCKSKGLYDMGTNLEIILKKCSETETIIFYEIRPIYGAVTDICEIYVATEYIVGCISLMGKLLRGELK